MIDRPTVQEPLRDCVARAIYEEPAGSGAIGRPDRPGWHDLSEKRREPWRRDADRVLAVLAVGCTPRMEKAAKEMEAVDWLAAGPAEVFETMIRAETACACCGGTGIEPEAARDFAIAEPCPACLGTGRGEPA